MLHPEPNKKQKNVPPQIYIQRPYMSLCANFNINHKAYPLASSTQCAAVSICLVDTRLPPQNFLPSSSQACQGNSWGRDLVPPTILLPLPSAVVNNDNETNKGKNVILIQI